MSSLSLIFLGAVCFIYAPKVSAMQCNVVGGATYSCPIGDNDKIFCCDTGAFNIQRCCDIEDFMKENSGIVAGIVIGAVVFVIIIILCCCCFCSCCCLAKRRSQRGHVVYGPVDGIQVIPLPTPTYQLVHPPPATQAYSPSPYNPNYDASQPSNNPYYK